MKAVNAWTIFEGKKLITKGKIAKATLFQQGKTLGVRLLIGKQNMLYCSHEMRSVYGVDTCKRSWDGMYRRHMSIPPQLFS